MKQSITSTPKSSWPGDPVGERRAVRSKFPKVREVLEALKTQAKEGL